MMRDRKISKGIGFLLLGVLFFVSNAEASSLASRGTWERKFQRGLLNTAFAPLEVSQALSEESARREEWFNWFALGVGRGAWFAALRALTGIYEVLTFPIPLPPHYAPISQPEFTLEYLGLLKEGGESREGQGV